MKDSSLQFVHWLNRAAEFNKQMKGNQMEEKTCFYCGSKATVEAYEVGKSVEQERIIKLLKELWETTYAQGPNYPGSNAVLTAIALIKGEN